MKKVILSVLAAATLAGSLAGAASAGTLKIYNNIGWGVTVELAHGQTVHPSDMLSFKTDGEHGNSIGVRPNLAGYNWLNFDIPDSPNAVRTIKYTGSFANAHFSDTTTYE